MHEDAILISFIYEQRTRTHQTFAREEDYLFCDGGIPRITRAQTMDALSSQSALAGYNAVALAMSALNRVLPKITTAAVVEGYDIWPATEEQALSFGAVTRASRPRNKKRK